MEDRRPQAAVIFTPDNRHWLAPALHPQFRHVFCAVQCGTSEFISVLVDLTIFRLEAHAVAGTPASLVRHYRQQGCKALLVDLKDDRVRLPLTSFTCVGLTKRLIGRGGMALTPYQLYNRLNKEAIPCDDCS